ncbi:MAG: 16S rRNA (cytidine(1402)-2'-O)-methyltransferase [Candidatus Levybacteria bacterium]|nr:16S rRNA (cytidine(1402)-2'-O)-methyltransferase [Candidatus Levybacteria bacterium]
MGNLYIVATPIGNLQDITLRALETLEEVDFIASEDTRKTTILINNFFKGKERLMQDKLFSYYEQVEVQKIPQVVNLLKNGKNVALVSDAGTPAVSDPGFKLIRECIKEGISVISIPGPSSILPSLTSSGLPTDKFLFLGFLPQKPGHRVKLLENLRESLKFINSTVIIFESPYKLVKSLLDIEKVFGDIEVVIVREITKIHEEIKKDKISNLLDFYKGKIKGEIVILFNLK